MTQPGRSASRVFLQSSRVQQRQPRRFQASRRAAVEALVGAPGRVLDGRGNRVGRAVARRQRTRKAWRPLTGLGIQEIRARAACARAR